MEDCETKKPITEIKDAKACSDSRGSLRDILNTAIIDFKNDIEKIITNENLKIKLNDVFNEISHVKVILFIYLIKEQNMDKQIKEFMDLYEIEKTDQNINILKRHYEYFLKIKDALI